ncbi:MAPEG family protein [Gayadomonas joobiniege]|uniref:MAPEG family protein n=1 Tax=Gayadomonas joobiniege TaxID=1234606 RepID=UPI0003705376|nr:MAPEG family protein [Gayadomonas joobiniege]
MLIPLSLMVVLTFIIGFRLFYLRVQSVKQGQVKAGYYRLKEGQGPDRQTVQAENAYNNQFQMPLIFYTACLYIEATGIGHQTFYCFAYLFVIFRYLHAVILMGYNQLLHRMLAFWLSTFCLIGLWLAILVAVYTNY